MSERKCVGLGRIFGHSFKQRIGDWIYKIDHCHRCGLHVPGYWLTRDPS